MMPATLNWHSFRDGHQIGIEVKMGGQALIELAASSLSKLKGKLSEQRAAQNLGLVMTAAGETSYSRNDSVMVISLGHLTA